MDRNNAPSWAKTDEEREAYAAYAAAQEHELEQQRLDDRRVHVRPAARREREPLYDLVFWPHPKLCQYTNLYADCAGFAEIAYRSAKGWSYVCRSCAGQLGVLPQPSFGPYFKLTQGVEHAGALDAMAPLLREAFGDDAVFESVAGFLCCSASCGHDELDAMTNVARVAAQSAEGPDWSTVNVHDRLEWLLALQFVTVEGIGYGPSLNCYGEVVGMHFDPRHGERERTARWGLDGPEDAATTSTPKHPSWWGGLRTSPEADPCEGYDPDQGREISLWESGYAFPR